MDKYFSTDPSQNFVTNLLIVTKEHPQLIKYWYIINIEFYQDDIVLLTKSVHVQDPSLVPAAVITSALQVLQEPYTVFELQA